MPSVMTTAVEPLELCHEGDDGPLGYVSAFFDGDAYLNFQISQEGAPEVLDIMASTTVSGRSMLDWLRVTYGLPVVLDVVPRTVDYWEKMVKEGRVGSYQTVAMSVRLSFG